MSDTLMLPDPPEFSDELVASCKISKDYRPILYEWYKYVCSITNLMAAIRPDSPGINNIEQIHYSICIGLLNRCARLMLSNISMSIEGRFGETVSIIDRCIFESCVKLAWLCERRDRDSFNRYLANGLKTELELKAEIEKAIQDRDGKPLEIEVRMLASIKRHLESSSLSENQVQSTKPLPDLASMLTMLGRSRLMYVVGQKIGSHHVHGTWLSLRLHYLDHSPDGNMVPRGHDCPTHQNQYIYVSLVVLDALKSFVEFALEPSEISRALTIFFEIIEQQIKDVMEEVSGNDFDIASAT